MNEKMKAIKLLIEAQTELENLPVGGIGADGASQDELDEASEQGQAFEDDAECHQGQQAWLKIQEAIKLLEEK